MKKEIKRHLRVPRPSYSNNEFDGGNRELVVDAFYSIPTPNFVEIIKDWHAYLGGKIIY